MRFALSVLAVWAAATVMWRYAMNLVFGPAQRILADPSIQSAKMLAAFAPGPSAPRMYSAPLLLWLGLAAVALPYAICFVTVTVRWRVAWHMRGIGFALLAWSLMAPWFEFYLPFNVLREPFPLVLLELGCWLGVHLLVGVGASGVLRLVAAGTATDGQGVSR